MRRVLVPLGRFDENAVRLDRDLLDAPAELDRVRSSFGADSFDHLRQQTRGLGGEVLPEARPDLWWRVEEARR